MSPDIAFASFAPSAALTMSNLMSASVLTTPKPVRASRSMTSSASTPTYSKPLPVQHDLTTPRARARAARLRAHEDAERREDLAALITTPVRANHPIPSITSTSCTRMTDLALFYFISLSPPPQLYQAQWAALRHSFASVKTEFADLDGMSWNAPPVPAVAAAPPTLGRPGRPLPRAPSTSVCGSSSAPVLARDDSTVRPSHGKKRRLSVSASGWGRQAACPSR
ncbi:hypothetical protein BJV74DRAFT_618952 [Russula compacta]|nr:hypothetical protein BJV74DRAFT_618952 [Russula compacta]